MVEIIQYVALGTSILGIAISFVIHSKLSKVKKALDAEVEFRGKQDDKLYYLMDSKFKVAMNKATNYEVKQQVRTQQPMQRPAPQTQYDEFGNTPDNQSHNFDDLINNGGQ